MNESLLLRVYGDSLSLPRPADGIGYGDVYPELIRDALEAAGGVRVSLWNRSRGGAPVSDLFQAYIHDSGYFPADVGSIVVIQCGIVDCAPRPIPPSVRERISRLPVALRWVVAKFLHFSRPILLRLGFRWRATELEVFAGVLSAWLHKASSGATRVYVINIAPTPANVDAHSPGLADSIVAYNRVINDTAVRNGATVVDVFAAIADDKEEPATYVNPVDGHHITPRGHRLYADLILAAESRTAAR